MPGDSAASTSGQRTTLQRGIQHRGTGDSAAGGETAARGHATRERGLAPGRVLFVFTVPVTPELRAATTANQRHRLILQTIMGLDAAEFTKFLRRFPGDAHWWGLTKPIPAGSTSVRYRMPRAHYLWGATNVSMTPTAVVQPDGEERPAADAALTISAVTSYRTAAAELEGSPGEFLRARVDAAVTGLIREEDAYDPAVIEGLLAASRIAEKLGRLDSRALAVLIERDPWDRTRPVRVAYTRQAALRHMRRMENLIDVLLVGTGKRAREAFEQATSLRQAIGRLEGFGEAWALRQRLRRFELTHSYVLAKGEAYYRARLRSPDLLSLIPGIDDVPREWLTMLDGYRAALRRAGATPPSLQQDFEDRIDAFYRTLGDAMHSMALESLSGLLVRIDDTLTRGEAHRFELYDSLAALLPEPGPYSDDQITALEPSLDQLAHDYPILGYRHFAEEVLKLFSTYRSPKFRHGTYPPRQRFAFNLHADLIEWRGHAFRARKAIAEDADTVWQADRLITAALDQVVPEDHYLRQVAAAHPQETHLLDVLLAAVSIALLFVPGGGWLVLVLRGALVAGETIALQRQFEEQSTVQSFADLGVASRAPSGWWLVLSAVSLGLDVADVAALLKVAPRRLVQAIEEDTVNALLREKRVARRAFAKSVLKKRRQDLGEKFFVKASEATAHLGSGPVINRAAVEAAGFMVKIGYTRFEEFLVDIRVLTGRHLADDALQRAFQEALRTASPAPETLPLDQIRRAVRERPDLRAKLHELDEQIERRRSTLDEVIDRGGDDSALRSAERAVAKLDKRREALRRRLAQADHLVANLDSRILQLERQARELGIAHYDALRALHRPGRQPRTGAFFREGDVDYATILFLERRAKDVDQRLRTLRRVKRGEPLARHERERLHEELVTMWLHEQDFTRVKEQVRIEVTDSTGKTTETIVDNLVEVDPGRFRVYDAKWAHDTHVAPGDGRQLLTTEKQKRAYLTITYDRGARVRIVDPEKAAHFGLTTEQEIQFEPLIYLVLGEPKKPQRTLLLR